MNHLLSSTAVEKLEILIEEATRSTDEGVKRFIEPAQGTFSRAVSKRPHIVFGRRGSGKSSLLRKAVSDLTVDRRPIAFVDLESFNGHSYPDVLISILIQTLERFTHRLDTAAINPANKSSFWQKVFGAKPKGGPFNKSATKELAERLRGEDSARSEGSGVVNGLEVWRMACDQRRSGYRFVHETTGGSFPEAA